MKKMLVLAAVLCCMFSIFADDDSYNESGYSENSNSGSESKDFYIQPTFGIGAAFSDWDPDNQFGISVGVDFVWSVWKNDAAAAGDLYVGGDVAFEYWVPTHDGDTKWHIMKLPLQAYVSYEFEINAGPLLAAGPWTTMGLSLDFGAFGGDYASEANDHTDSSDKVRASFVWGLGGTLAFEGNWALKAGFGGNAGGSHHGWHWNTDSHFMAEAAYRF